MLFPSLAALRVAAFFIAGWLWWRRRDRAVGMVAATLALVTAAEVGLVVAETAVFLTVGDAVLDGAISLLALVSLLAIGAGRRADAHPTADSAILEQLFERSLDGVVLLDERDRVLRTNAQFTKMFGYTEDEAVGRRINDLIVPDDLKAEGAELTGMIAAGRTMSAETVREHRDGTRVPVSIVGTPTRIASGQVAVCGIYRDITARKSAEHALRRSEETTRTILDTLRDGYCEIDTNSKVVACNTAFCEILGYEPEELRGRGTSLFLDEENTKKLAHLLRWIGSGGELQGAAVWDVVRKDGEHRSVEGSVSPRRTDDDIRGFHVIIRDVTERRAAEDVMRQQWTAIETSLDGVAIIGKQGHFEYVNDAFATMFGYDAAPATLGLPWTELYATIESEGSLDAVLAAVETEGQWSGETVGVKADGSQFPQEISLSRLGDGGLTLVVRDITLRRRSEQALRESEERYALAARGANDGLWDWNLTTGAMYFSPRWKAMLGYGEHDVKPTSDEWFDRVHPDDIEILRAKIAAHLAGKSQHFESEHRLRHHDGRFRWMLCRGSALADQDGVVYRMAGSLSDITDRKHVEQRLHHDAFHDDLTQLPNRALLMDRLDHALQRVRRRGEYLFAVLFLDLDGFKMVNDSLGHPLGDQLLNAVATRLNECIRPNDTVARLGGDEFVILLDGVGGMSDATAIAERIHEKLAHPVRLGDHDVVTSASIGITLSTGEYDRSDQVLRDADLAMYRAKTLGKARHEVFDGEMHEQMLARLELETDLRRAVEREEFQVYYQPIVALDTGDIVAFEALLRWQHPERGFVSPEVFVPVAEETGLVISLGLWVLERAARQMKVWLPYLPRDRNICMYVNLSRRQFRQPDLADRIRTTLRRTGLEPERLGLEITESVVMDDAASATKVLEQLRSLSVRLQIDDFGTGYSSLSYLHRFPIDALKIDRSFVRNMGDGKNAEIVRSIITLAHDLGMDVIAEGVETTDQLAELRRLDCQLGQGHYFCEAVPPDSPLLVEREIITRVAVIR